MIRFSRHPVPIVLSELKIDPIFIRSYDCRSKCGDVFNERIALCVKMGWKNVVHSMFSKIKRLAAK